MICKEKKEFKKAILLITRCLALRGALGETAAVNDDDATIINLADLYCQISAYSRADSIYKKEIAKFRKAGVEAANIYRQTVASFCNNLIMSKKIQRSF